MLLPLPMAAAEKMLLQIHVALAACRRPKRGTSYQFNELLPALDITYHLQERGFAGLPMQVYASAELGMNTAITNAEQQRAWFIDAPTASLLGKILSLHDQQLRSIARSHSRILTAATERLKRFVASQRASPLPDGLCAEARNSLPTRSYESPCRPRLVTRVRSDEARNVGRLCGRQPRRTGDDRKEHKPWSSRMPCNESQSRQGWRLLTELAIATLTTGTPAWGDPPR
ncbi:hypothetical protein [Caballeronia fortuita]|nr:hypothetical protein [Caballeronia fortuita]